MSISSVSNSWAAILNQYSPYQTTNNNTTNNDTTTNKLDGAAGISSDGDTFQMSGALPPAPPAYNSSGADNSSDSSYSSASTQLSTAEMFSKLDTDGDGAVSESEFAAARPSDVTEEMAQNLYSSFDTDSSGSLTESEYETAMNNAPSLSATDSSSDSSSTTDASQLAAAMMLPPPPANNSDTTTDSSSDSFSSLDSDIVSFLNKIEEGTAADSDIQTMQSELKQYSSTNSYSSSVESNGTKG
ncbi:MAG: EF-hand domain-containing protein [Veillonellales bacterium]